MPSDTMTVLEDMILEEFGPTIRELEIPLDPVFKDVVTSNENTTSQGIGEGWEVNHTWVVGLAGGIKAVDKDGGDVNIGPSQDEMTQSLVFGDQDTFPTAAESPSPALFTSKIELAKMYGNFYLPIDVIKATTLNASLGDYAAKQIRAAAKKVALFNAHTFFKDSDENMHEISSVDNSNAEHGAIEYEVDDGPIRECYPGLAVIITDDAGTTVRNAGVPIVIDKVDYINGTVHLISPGRENLQDTGELDGDVEDGDLVFFENTQSEAVPAGLLDWIKDSGSIFGIDLSEQPQFKSLLDSGVGNLTDHDLNKVLNTFNNAYGYVGLDTIITTRGVTQKYLEQPTLDNGNLVWDRGGKPLNYVGGVSNVSYVYDGTEFDWRVSTFVKAGDMFIIKAKNNLVRYVPPALPKAGSEGNFSGEVEFVAPALGYPTIFAEERTATGALSPKVQVPYQIFMERAVEDPRSIYLSDLNESV